MINRTCFAVLAVILLLAAGVHTWRVSANVNLGFCDTPSVPRGFYALYRPNARPARDSYACLLGTRREAPEALRRAIATGLTPSYFRYRPLLKQVAGLPGDRITYVNDLVHVNGRALPDSTALSEDSLGQKLPSPTYPITLQKGEVWLAAIGRGFDSRYFGPVRVDALSCTGRPLWTF
jgi:conjugative transfer signal peptidase TraF